ncbi:anosmin-1-like [Biomphalaria glabrata]|uniref:Anosmin-1-like n=1 Tax=Biomphalaria glabrata TaxID=6526 RepID=A0A9W2YZZ5_BIOGL|nr:anosmin-1-like [Biomphalaria glabrata]
MSDTGTGISLLFLWITFISLFQLGGCNYAEILWGQCYTFCLNRSEIQRKVTAREIDPGVKYITKDKLIQACKKHQICKWCLYACDRPVKDYENHVNCLKDCDRHIHRQKNNKAHKACTDSCSVISTFLQRKFGSCPLSNTSPPFQGNCTDKCGQDIHCTGIEKCCQTSCASECKRPVEHEVIPQKPSNITFKEKSDGRLLIEWRSTYSSMVAAPVLYILRWWCPYSLAPEFKFTTITRVKLKGYPVIQPGSKCNYMLAAINVHGSEGFTFPRTYTKEFLKPSPPNELKHIRTKEHGKTVDMTIHWHPPRHTDGLNVTNYMISWSDGLPRGRSDYMRLHMHRKSIKGDRYSFTIQRLNPCTVYFVQVQAVIKWDHIVTFGQPASIYIEACLGPQPAGKEVETIPHVDPEKSYHIYNVTIHDARFVDSQLKANVTWSLIPGSNVKHFKIAWKLDVCEGESQHRKTRDRLHHQNITEVKHFTLYGLLSDCIYEVSISIVNYTGAVNEGRKERFRTSSCLATLGVIPELNCPEEVTKPLPPVGLQVVHRKMNCMCQSLIQWERNPDSGHKIKNYIVLWGQSRPSTKAIVIYNSPPFQLQVPKDDFRACLTYLERSKHYTIQVIAQTSNAKSIPAITHFETPENMSACYGVQPVDDTRVTDYFNGAGAEEMMANLTTNMHNVTVSSSGVTSSIQVSSWFLCPPILLAIWL